MDPRIRVAQGPTLRLVSITMPATAEYPLRKVRRLPLLNLDIPVHIFYHVSVHGIGAVPDEFRYIDCWYGKKVSIGRNYFWAEAAS